MYLVSCGIMPTNDELVANMGEIDNTFHSNDHYSDTFLDTGFAHKQNGVHLQQATDLIAPQIGPVPTKLNIFQTLMGIHINRKTLQ